MLCGEGTDERMLRRTQAKTKSDAAYERLRRAVITFEIEGGEPLDEASLMERFEVGRTPLREALKRLAVEGFVVAPPHSTPYVRPVSMDELQALYETRLLLEVQVCARAAERVTDREVAHLEQIMSGIQKAIAEDDVYEDVELDFAFHTAVATATKNRFLAEAINQLNRSSLRLWYLAHLRMGISHTDTMHAGIIEALRRRDPAAASSAMRGHILESRERVATALVFGAEGSGGNGADSSAEGGA
jgi:DNA-binding GntR family transcriptional regulator